MKKKVLWSFHYLIGWGRAFAVVSLVTSVRCWYCCLATVLTVSFSSLGRLGCGGCRSGSFGGGGKGDDDVVTWLTSSSDTSANFCFISQSQTVKFQLYTNWIEINSKLNSKKLIIENEWKHLITRESCWSCCWSACWKTESDDGSVWLSAPPAVAVNSISSLSSTEYKADNLPRFSL